MLAVLGVLKTEAGIEIKKEMLSWLEKEHDVLCIEQEPPGIEFEYPAIKAAIRLSIDMNEPVLYLHTKGAANKIPLNYKTAMMAATVNFPISAKPKDCQIIVRNMWKHEFTGERLKLYNDIVNTTVPTVACPLTGKEKLTWQNGFILNSFAAKELLKTFHFTNNRWYYEQMFNNTSINVKGVLSNDIHIGKDELKMWDIIWKFYEEN